MYNPYNMPLAYQNEWTQFNFHRQNHGGHHGGHQHHGGHKHHSGKHHHGGHQHHGGHSDSKFNFGSLGSSLLGFGLGYLGSGLLNGPGQGGYGFGGYGGYPGYGGFGGYGGGPAQGFNPYVPGVGGGIGFPPVGGPGYPGLGPNLNMYGQFQPNPGYSGYGSWSPDEYGLPR